MPPQAFSGVLDTNLRTCPGRCAQSKGGKSVKAGRAS